MTVKVNREGKFPDTINLKDGITAEQIITQVRKIYGTLKFSIEIEHEGKWINGFEYNKLLKAS